MVIYCKVDVIKQQIFIGMDVGYILQNKHDFFLVRGDTIQQNRL
ncbi:hypothetical protein FLA_1977 [Filimonas lacunae]|nr:hypothetical protein FLA_1977 [Filimonas lacunae]